MTWLNPHAVSEALEEGVSLEQLAVIKRWQELQEWQESLLARSDAASRRLEAAQADMEQVQREMEQCVGEIEALTVRIEQTTQEEQING